jgi:hypothetical protein
MTIWDVTAKVTDGRGGTEFRTMSTTEFKQVEDLLEYEAAERRLIYATIDRRDD